MSRFIKEMMAERYAWRLREVSDLAVVSTKGVNVGRMVAFRRTLRERGIRAMVVQNRLCRRVLGSAGLETAATLLAGPSTLVWGGESIVEIARTLVEQAKDLAGMEICGGFADGRIFSSAEIEALSRLPSREELIGQVVGRAVGQAARVAALATAPAGRVLSQIREYEKIAPASEAAPARTGRMAEEPPGESAQKEESQTPDEEAPAESAGTESSEA